MVNQGIRLLMCEFSNGFCGVDVYVWSIILRTTKANHVQNSLYCYSWASCRYDIQTNSWSFVCSMSAVRSTAGVAVLEERLYVVGGRDSLSCLNSGEFYDPHTNKWSPMPPMSVGRGGLGVTALHGKLYAVGGHDSLQPLDSVEVFDPCTNQWTLIEPMKNLRDAVAVTSFGNKVHAIGGFNGSSYLDSVEYYDPETGEWVNSWARIQAGRAGAAVVVLPDLAPDTIATLDD